MGAAFFTAEGFLAVILSLAFFHLVVVCIDIGSYISGDQEFMESKSMPLRGLAYSLLAFLTWVAWPTEFAPFIYFQF